MADNEDYKNSSWYSEPGGSFIKNKDGSLDRIGDVPDHVKEMAEEMGLEIAPDHIPAEDIGKYFPNLAPKPPPITDEDPAPPVRDRRIVRWKRRKY